MAGRLLLVLGIVLGFIEVARCEGNYQNTRDGKTLVWNSTPKSGDVATWSGDRDRDDYAHGFGLLVWYTRQPESTEPQLYARFWGRMVNGKFEGPVNVHAKGKTHHAIFIDGTRMTRWAAGTASTRANAQWRTLAAKHNQKTEVATTTEPRPGEPVGTEELRRDEPAAPAAGPGPAEMSPVTSHISQTDESIQDLYNERWPKIDIDESLRLLVYPPRTLR